MKSIQVHIPALLAKIRELSERRMAYVRLSIGDEAIDQNVCYPAYLHFEAFAPDGTVADFESIDALTFFECGSGQEQAG